MMRNSSEVAGLWQNLQPSIPLAHSSSVADAIEIAQQSFTSKPLRVLITGSTFLVGQALALLEDTSVSL